MNPVHRHLILASTALVLAVGGHEGAKYVQTPKGVLVADYRDPVGITTACYGHTATAKLGTLRTKDECNSLLSADLKIAGDAVLRHVTVRITQGMYDALADFVYNVGETNFRKSTLLRKLNAGDYLGASAEFDRWKFAQGVDCSINTRVCGGIIKRRQWEKEMFLHDLHSLDIQAAAPAPVAPAAPEPVSFWHRLLAVFKR